MRHLRPVCSQCVYWIGERSTVVGHCHRHPPAIVVNPETGTVSQRFPTTDHQQWCGEWKGDETELVAAARQCVVKRAQTVEKQ